MNALRQDVIYGFRVLAKKPLFTAVAVLSIALGIALNTVIFTLTNTILLRSLPFREPDRLVSIFSLPPNHPDQLNGGSIPDLFAWRQQARSFESIGCVNNNAFDFGAEENGISAERIRGEVVTPSLLDALGVQPIVGRLFTQDEDEIDHPAPVIILSHRIWMRRFGGDKDILRRKILVNGRSTAVIGVMPADFRITDEAADWFAPIPINHFQLQRSARFVTVFGRLKPGVSLAQAQSEMDAISVQLAQQFPARDADHGKPWMVRLQTAHQALFGTLSRPLLLLQGAVGFVLLIACANIAGLLMARASSRTTEVAIRAALGAGRARIFRQFLTESVVLSIFGGLFGFGLAWAGVRALVAMAPPWLPRLNSIGMNPGVLLFSAIISLATGLIIGVIPAVQGSKGRFAEPLKNAVRGGTPGGARYRLRSVLVAGQLALALMLLIGAGLLIRSFLQLENADLGSDPHGLLTFRYRFASNDYGKPINNFKGLVLWELNLTPTAQFRRIFDRLQGVPGIISVGGSAFPPFTGNNPVNFTIEGKTLPNEDGASADFYPISPNFFATMKIKLLRGRDFSDRDTLDGPSVVVINETLAHRFFAGENPIGKYLRTDFGPNEPLREIVGVARDIPASNPQPHQDPAIFAPYLQMQPQITGPYASMPLQMTFLIRTQGDPMRELTAVRRAVEEIDRNRPLIDPRTEDSYLDEQAQYPRYYSMLLGLFAAVATGLAAVGIYGVMAYTVEQRTREIGIRIALGAAASDVFRIVARQALMVIAAGVITGLGGAMALTRFISSEMWEVKATDPESVAISAALLAAIAVLACLAPARCAVRVDAAIALRHE
jgi:putative ABC transport system permease protein